MTEFKELAKWAVTARKNGGLGAHGARWLAGREHSVLGRYSIAQCQRADHLAWLICKQG